MAVPFKRLYEKFHSNIQFGSGPHSCDYPGCEYATNDRSNLRRHKRTHTGEKKYLCDYAGCKYATSDISTFNKHKRIHTGEKPYVCDYPGCEYAATLSHLLARHKRTHTGEKPYVCDHPGCEYTTSDNSHLKRHKLKHENDIAEILLSLQKGSGTQYRGQKSKLIIVVGGGPVGLYAAIQMKRKFPSSDVSLFEKRPQYTRNQILLLKKESVKRFPLRLIHDIWGKQRSGCYVQPPPLTTSAKCYIMKRKGLNSSVVTSTLENSMKQLALRLKVRIFTQDVSLEDVKKMSEKADVLIGADGHDSVVGQLLNAKTINGKDSYGIGVTFTYSSQDKGKERILARSPQHRYRAFRSNENKGYVGINVSHDEYMSFLNGNDLDYVIQSALRYYGFSNVTDIQSWPIKIIPYKKSRPALVVDHAKVFLVGDAAIGTHFFTGSGVNMGFDSVMFLVDNFAKHGLSKIVVDKYKKFINNLSKINTKNVKSVSIPFQKTLTKCVAFSDTELARMAKQVGIKHPNVVPRTELCYLIANILRKKHV